MLRAKRQHPCHCSAERYCELEIARRSVVNARVSLCPLLLMTARIDVHRRSHAVRGGVTVVIAGFGALAGMHREKF
jgi:hypothetical protein